MTLRYTTTRVIGAAIAISLGSVATAAAQTPVRKDVPSTPSSPTPVTKDQTPAPAPAPAPSRDTTASLPAPAPAPTPAPVDTTTTTTTTTTTVSTGEVPAPTMHMRNGWYIGVAGAGEIPQNALRDFYKTGWGVEVPIGWDPVNSPLGLRLNLGYARLNAKDNISTVVNGSTLSANLSDPQIFQAVGDAKLRLPFGKGLLSGLYAVGGGGVYYFKNYSNTLNLTTNPGTAGGAGQGNSGGNVTYTFNAEDKTRFGANIGGGVQFGLGNAALYLESRYVRIFTPNRDSDMVPVALGVTFNW
jgi:hypothetical protein